MTNTVYTKTYDSLSINIKEIRRYAQIAKDLPEFDELIESCIKEVENKISFKVCYAQFSIAFHEEYLDLGFAKVRSNNLRKNLENCESIVLFAATIGIEIDRLIAKYSKISPSKALIFQAIGTERIESLCDAFNADIERENKDSGKFTAPRFSPGYGDLELSLQSDVFKVLDCSRKIGISLNDSLLMSPSKSVTAIIGIKEKACDEESDVVCESCDKTNCAYRRTV